LAKRNAKALSAGEVEDPRLMRFNNTIAAMVLGGAQLAFLLGLESVGWGLSLAVAAAAGVALAGFCIGCFFLSLPSVPFSDVWKGLEERVEREEDRYLLQPELTVRASYNEGEGSRPRIRTTDNPLVALIQPSAGKVDSKKFSLHEGA
jgi:Domain of unknown function (DUF4395)